MRDWTLAGTFDAGHIRGWTPDFARGLDFHQLEVTGHAARLEEDYAILREEFGLSSFRDGLWLARTFLGPGRYDWSYLDRLAALSRGEVWLSLCHYEWPPWLDEESVRNGRVVDLMAEFAAAVAHRYALEFAGYVPVVESAYWTAMSTEWGRWWPGSEATRGASWWSLYTVVGRMTIEMARAIRSASPGSRIAMSEPWLWHPTLTLDDFARPFDLLLGRPDPVAVRETGTDAWGGDPALLDVVALNFYNDWGAEHGWPLSRLLLEARRRFPDKEIMLGETGNCQFPDCHPLDDWLALVEREVAAANAGGARLTTVTWAPVLTIADFEWGHPAPGAWITWDPGDPTRRRRWDPAVARTIRELTCRPQTTSAVG